MRTLLLALFSVTAIALSGCGSTDEGVPSTHDGAPLINDGSTEGGGDATSAADAADVVDADGS